MLYLPTQIRLRVGGERVTRHGSKLTNSRGRTNSLRVRFFKKIQDWIRKTKRIRKRILCFSIKLKRLIQDLSDRGASKGTEESISRMDSSVASFDAL